MKAGRATRRGIAGVVAIVIIFAILFTVGTSYYVFVNAQNATYAQKLLSAANRVEGSQAESLIITTLLEPNGDVGFFANDTSALSVNMTAALVISSTGALLECAGVGFPAGAGCTNSTPPLWMIVNADGGSTAVDTGYVYTQGNTVTVKVLTARGNSYSSTYPPSASQSGSTQSVTVNLDNLKWVQLIPQASSLAQEKYVANCNAASCAASFTSSVTAGNILVDAVSWPNQAPPGSVPTDTRNDLFTLGASSSVTVPSSPALVQNRYTSNCNAASCGLAFSSSVTSGNTLVFSLGWANKSPPTAPTDTRGDSFTLGTSQSVTVNPNSPTAVQERYLANCNSASCGLAFSSNVAAGDTLVFGLGWYGTSPYVPVTITNPGSSSISVDNSADNECDGASSCSVSLTTTNANDLIYLSITDSSGGLSVNSLSDGASLSWTARQSLVQGSYDIFTYYAKASSALSSDSISVTMSGSANLRLEVVGVSGANLSSPFDPSLSTAPTNTGSSSTPTITFSTTNANDLIIGAMKSASNTVSSGASGYTSLICCTSNYAAFEYEVVSATGSYTPSFSLSGSGNWGEIGDAIEATTGSATPSTFQEKVTWNPSTYSTYEGSNLGNIRFCADSACATPLYAWLESCTSSCTPSATSATAWVKLTSSIAAGGSTTIYMVFEATSVNFDGNYWGEAPNLSSPYAQFDNGANVFTAYFNGNTAISGFSTFTGYSLAQATGIVGPGGATINAIQATGFNGNDPVFAFSTAMANTALVVETSFSSPNSVAPGTDTGAAGLVDSAVAANVNNGVSANMGYGAVYFDQDYDIGGGFTTDVNPQGAATANWVYATLTYTGPASTSWSAFIAPQLYSATGGFSGTVANNPLSGATNLYLGQISGTAAAYPISIYYNFDRARVYPPNGVMPSTGFGSLTTGNGSPSGPADTLGDAFTLGASNSITVSGVNYYSYIWYGTASRAGGDTISATFASAVTGSVSIYELAGYTTSGPGSSTGSSAGGSTALSVTTFTPASNSFVVGNAETAASSSVFTAGSGLTLVSSTGCATVYGCSEYETGAGSATTVPLSIVLSSPWVESAVSFAPMSSNTYYSYIWYATAGSSGADTVSAAFSQAVAGSVSIYELSGLTVTGLLSSTGSSSTSQSSSSVTSMTPSAGSIVVGNVETTSTTFTAGIGYTLSGTCNSVPGCGEYQSGVGSATTVPTSLSSAGPWVEAALAFAPTTTNYYSYIWYATARASGADTITTTFGSTTQGSVSLYEITGYTTSGALSSTGSSSSGSTTSSVTAFTPASDSFLVGTAESAASNTFTAGSGFTLAGTCSSVGGCSQYDAGGGGSASTVPTTLSTSSGWVEAAMSFSTPFNPQSGIQVGGYPTMGVPSGASLVWEVTFTDVDAGHRSVTIWPQTELAVGSAEFDGYDTDYTQAHYYIVDGLNPGSTTVNGYTSTTGQYITLAYGVPTTLYFASTKALGSTTQSFGTNVLTPFQAYFALTGIYGDGTLFGETVPYPFGIITQSNAYTTPTAGSTGATVTVSCTSPCHFSANSKAMVGWINAAGVLTALTTFTTTAGGNIPSGVTFTVPTATAGYDTIEVTDYTNSVFSTFQHT